MTLEYLDWIPRETRAFVEAARGHFDRRVPSCPEWDMEQLAQHTWEVLAFWTEVVERKLQNPRDATGDQNRPSREELLDRMLIDADRAVEVLRGTDPHTRIWTWARVKNVSFVPRRIANELSIHRWDAQNAVGAGQPIDRELAADGVDEYLDLFADAFADWKGVEQAVVSFRAADERRGWTLELTATGRTVLEKALPDAPVRVSGPASTLVLLLWGRVPASAAHVEGDHALLDRVLNSFDRT